MDLTTLLDGLHQELMIGLFSKEEFYSMCNSKSGHILFAGCFKHHELVESLRRFTRRKVLSRDWLTYYGMCCKAGFISANWNFTTICFCRIRKEYGEELTQGYQGGRKDSCHWSNCNICTWKSVLLWLRREILLIQRRISTPKFKDLFKLWIFQKCVCFTLKAKSQLMSRVDILV